jgi:predicted phage tail protein
VYCDGTITSTTRTRQDDGTYVDVESTEPRFSFNGVLDTRGQGLVTVAAVCSAMRAKPIWTGGQIVFVQDKPITTPARPVSPSNVIDGNFVYEGVAKRFRHSVAKVSWNNPEIFGRLDTLELVDDDAVITFGYNSFDFAALGCTSRTEAIRRGNYVLDTDINARESVSFGGGLEWADALPGELLSVQDPNYAATTYEGRVVSGTTTSLVPIH